jgi:riboflavin kinase/FMN adenylyltransferase
MDVLYFPESQRPYWASPVVALGNFDGVHRGHQALLERVKRSAAEQGGTAVALTFDPHPASVLRPDKAPPLIMTLEQRLEAFERAGMEGVAIVRFTPDLARWEPELFVDTVLIDWLHASEVWVGANFLFGRDRAGTFTLLKTLGADRAKAPGPGLGFHADKIDPVLYRDFAVSSSRIRRLVTEGRVDEASALLGRQFSIDGTVVHGDARGRTLGFPTANLETANTLLPAYGIYATIAIVDGVHHPAVSSVGIRPTIGDNRLTIESYLLDFSGDLYGKRMRLAFIARLRDEARFDSLEALKTQMTADAADAARLLAAHD